MRDVLTSLKSFSRITDCELGAVLLTFYDRQTNESYLQLKHLADTFKELVWPPIPQDVNCRESTCYGQTLWEYAPATRAMLGYPDSGGKTVGGVRAGGRPHRGKDAVVSPAKRRPDNPNTGFVQFEEEIKPRSDPVVEAILTRRERVQEESRLPKKERTK